jgi:hypothetical protein
MTAKLKGDIGYELKIQRITHFGTVPELKIGFPELKIIQG